MHQFQAATIDSLPNQTQPKVSSKRPTKTLNEERYFFDPSTKTARWVSSLSAEVAPWTSWQLISVWQAHEVVLQMELWQGWTLLMGVSPLLRQLSEAETKIKASFLQTKSLACSIHHRLWVCCMLSFHVLSERSELNNLHIYVHFVFPCNLIEAKSILREQF